MISTASPVTLPSVTPPSNTPAPTQPAAATSQPPAPTVAAPADPATSPPALESSVVLITRSDGPLTVLVTSSAAPPSTQRATQTSSIRSSSSAPATPTPVSATSSNPTASAGGLSAGGKIAVAVVVPVAAVALILITVLYFWRQRRQRKDAEELRRKEVEEYNFNPNTDPTLAAVVTEEHKEKDADGAGYRGWGTTSTARKPSTTLSAGNAAVGVARSDSGSNPGGYVSAGATSPTGGTDVQSNDPLIGSPGNGRPGTADSETIGALGSGPVAAGNRQENIHRGPSNASSAYSGGHRSEASDSGIPNNAGGSGYYQEGMYYEDGMPQHGPYGDGTYGTGQVVIRDVQARRNTRIENPTVFPQQAGIAQNF